MQLGCTYARSAWQFFNRRDRFDKPYEQPRVVHLRT